ncbi:LapB repeat-containing protein [endosymbiont 'TC1' of Trimyema compressum]|uniref:LapB repeat-containing protein n=1 Tax=endosymbiont 'TC1' of Trimyema compressum TaxID=243899 RepID=UPI00155F4683
MLIFNTGLSLLAGTQKNLPGPTPINQVFPDSILAEKMRASLCKGAVTDLVTQSELDALTSVDVSMSQGTPKEDNIQSIEGFEYIHNATNVGIGGTAVTDLAPLGTMTSVKNLILAASTVVDISPLANLVNLEYIYGSYTDIKDLSALANLTKLSTLTLFNTKVEDVTPLRNLTNLTSLNVVAFVKDFTPILHLTNIKSLNVRGDGITDPRIFNSLTNLTSIQISNQRITLDSYTVGSDGKATITNPVVDSDGNPIDAVNISDSGTYSNGVLTWENLNAPEPAVAYEFSKSIVINGLTTTYNGNVLIPLEFDTQAPVIQSDSEITYTVDATVSESEFLDNINASTDDGSPITSDFTTAVNLSTIGDYTVTLNSVDGAGNKAIPVTVTVHVVKAEKAPVITCDKEVTYKLNSTKSEAEFLKDIHGLTNDGFPITTDFNAVVNMNKVDDYRVTLNAEDALGNKAIPATVVVHVVSDGTPVNPNDNSDITKGVLNGLPKTGTMSPLDLFRRIGFISSWNSFNLQEKKKQIIRKSINLE